MALRKKLYYPIVVSGDSGEVPAVPANVQILNDSNNPVMPIASAALRCFGDQSLPDFGVNQGAPGSTAPGSDGDRYGNVMDPNLFAGVDPANDLSGQQRTRQAIGVWFQVESRTGNPIPTAKVSLDFILSSAPIRSEEHTSELQSQSNLV